MRRAFALLLAACACGGEESAPAADAGRENDGGAGAIAAAELPGLPPFPPHVRSLRLRRSISVRAEPSPEAERLGTVARDTRVAWRSARVAPGCDGRWIEIEPRGWVCEEHLEPSTRDPDGIELPRLARGELVPGVYGKLAREAAIITWKDGALTGKRPLQGSATVRRLGEAMIAGAPHWRIGPDEYVPASLIKLHQPSSWSGTRLGDDTGIELPIGFAMAKEAPFGWVTVWTTPQATEKVRRIRWRTRVPLLESARGADGEIVAWRIGEGEWLRAGDVRVASAAPPPPGLLPGERWIDIDLTSQVLVAYEGERPVYATLVSSGAKTTPTPTGVYRVWLKLAETDMSGGMGESDAYSVATVPWTQFYAPDLALHTSYWHDKFGTPRSHGCINLAPIDARFLYFWSEPDVPPGWSMACGLVQRPGSVVRVRSAEAPEPEVTGYAVRVLEARRARAGR